VTQQVFHHGRRDIARVRRLGLWDYDLILSLLTASDVLGTSWFGAVAVQAGPGKTVAVAGDGAAGLLAVLAAKQTRRRADHRDEPARAPGRSWPWSSGRPAW